MRYSDNSAGGALIIDVMELIHGTFPPALPKTFGELAAFIMSMILRLALKYQCPSTSTMCSTYIPSSASKHWNKPVEPDKIRVVSACRRRCKTTPTLGKLHHVRRKQGNRKLVLRMDSQLFDTPDVRGTW